MDFLTKNGLFIFDQLKKHCKEKLKLMEIDDLELGMLANAFDIYATNAKYCRDNGQTYEMKTKTGMYPMIRPEYNIMKDCYDKIQKHSGKFGLNPGDRERIFKSIGKEKEKKGFDLGEMKVSKTG